LILEEEWFFKRKPYTAKGIVESQTERFSSIHDAWSKEES
jgi:hypothetical protein